MRAAPSAPYRRDLDELRTSMESAGRRFGFQVEVAGEAPRRPPTGLGLTHLLVIDDGPFSDDKARSAARALADWGSVSIAFAYPGRAELFAAEPSIEAWKASAGPALNFLFPDVCRDGWQVVSNGKIVDNAVCDTVRVKYLPLRVCRDVTVSRDAWAYFSAASRLFAREQLYLRAPTDGYIALRQGDGFLITATRTSKVELDSSRISLVHGYDEVTGTLSYSGQYLPSSDAVEAAVLLAGMPNVDYLVHTHASRLFTRNPAWRDRVLVPQLPYGEPALGRALLDGLAEVGDGFVIMAEHGEVFAGSGLAECFLSSIAHRCERARRGSSHA
ncbi:MAG: class II aldolase/adducin family protein [Hyphomicrobiaceae bacterium]|nr:class II aldolase/adducin family protein [Hyphomicrobiaceae bacterium]